MNRLLICIILLAFSNTALAEKLYRWIEADGSITFSPNPPPKGVDFKMVDAAQMNSGAGQSPLSKQPSIMATSEHDLVKPAARVNDTEILTRPTPAVSKQLLSYAPETSNAKPSATQSIGQQVNNQTDAAPAVDGQTIASSNKKSQCQDLSKRVLSLERRLRLPLQPDDMDNTVIAMARYQKSYDQHCVN